jgi:fumarate reductase subunit D
MTSGEVSARKVAALLVRHAAWISPASRGEWFQAMANELDHISGGVSALWWALGCASVSYLERMNIMTRSLTSLPRWLLSIEMAVCLVPLTWLFIAVLAMTGRGIMPLQYGILSALASLLGPLGLAVAVRIVFFADKSVGRVMTIILTLLAAWTVLAYTDQALHNGTFVSTWRDYVLIALLPAMAVLHLLQISSQRRAMRAMVCAI